MNRTDIDGLGQLLDMFLFLLSVALILIVILDPLGWLIWALLGILTVLIAGRLVLAFTWERELEGRRRR